MNDADFLTTEDPYKLTFLEEVERSIIGYCLVFPEKSLELGLRPVQFRNANLGKIFSTVTKQVEAGNPVDEISIASLLGSGEDSETQFWQTVCAGAISAQCLDGAIPSAVEHVRKEHLRREFILLTDRALRQVSEVDDPGELFQWFSGQLDTLTASSVSGDKLVNLYEEAQRAVGNLPTSENCLGLPTGLGLEKIVPGGVPVDKVTVLFGETGTFKTTLKDNLKDNFALHGHKVLDFNMEDSLELNTYRALSRITGVPYARIAAGTLTEAEKEELREVPESELAYLKNITIVSDIPSGADEVVRIARSMKHEGIKAVFIDYITLLDWGRDGERAMLNDAMLKFQRAAKRDRMAYIVVSQLSDDRLHAAGRPDARPILRDLFGSSTIGKACKLAIATYRPGKYGPPRSKYDKEIYGEIYASDPEEYNDVIELWVRKNIMGEDNVPIYTLCDRRTGLMEPYDV